MIILMQDYGIGPRLSYLLSEFWDKKLVALRDGRYYGDFFKKSRGLTQGDIFSSTIFNIIVDEVSRHLDSSLRQILQEYPSPSASTCSFYVDDGLIDRTNMNTIIQLTDLEGNLFDRGGTTTVARWMTYYYNIYI